ncbi:MAG: molybdopterin-dependent oxidoreductase [Vicinamibacterales bacterium]|nr:molybdopterin-dependent oxidoreductase [Vicinamibacterales bacterium]
MNTVIIPVSRRGFLKGLVSAGAFVLGARVLPLEALAAAQASTAPWEPSVYLALEPDGRVLIIAHRSEMGTGIRTVLPTIVADELDADWDRVEIVQALGDKKYGSQNTDGSCSIRDFYVAMREAGATARLMLERAAAAQWNVPASECRVQLHTVGHQASGRSAEFGALVTAASALPMPAKEELRFKQPSEYRYIGKNVPIIDLEDLCNGRGTFGMDAVVPGMVYATIERPPVLGATLKSHQDAAALKVAGVEQTVVLETTGYPVGMKMLGGVAVIARDTWSAIRGRQALKVEWDLGPHASYDTAAFKKTLIATARQPGRVARSGGDVDAALASATRRHEATYYTPPLSHAPMEPPVAVASVKDGKAEVWAPTQNPQAVQSVVAAALGITETDVICHVTLLGGGFGRKSFPDYCAEAAVLSQKIGKPVKVVWTREDDIRHDFYHGECAMHMQGGLDAQGKPVAWLQRSVFPPIGSIFNVEEQYGGGQLNMGWTDVPFAISNFRAENGPSEAHVRIGWLRAVANVHHAFGVQSFIDELAHLAGRDPIEYWLETLGASRKLDAELKAQGYELRGLSGQPQFVPDTARLRRVVELVRDRSGWATRKTAPGHGWGFAAHRSFFSYIATVVEVRVDDDGTVHIPRVDMAVDCGLIINPDRVIAQFEGAATFGAGVAMVSALSAQGGRIREGNFHNYQVPRIHQAPLRTHVHIVETTEPPAGVGEPGVPPVAPAICNAIFAATGKRVRELPVGKVT